eukprot:scaffold40342_cov61-Attheya_sp.AAC.5
MGLIFRIVVVLSACLVGSDIISVQGFTVSRTNVQQQLSTARSMSSLKPVTRCGDKAVTREGLILFAAGGSEEKEEGRTGKGVAKFASTSFSANDSSTGIVDVVLNALTSDMGGIVLGSLGLVVAIFNRLSALDVTPVEGLGQQSRADLLAVFACLAVLLNGVSKLDVTSALAESVQLDGIPLSAPSFTDETILKNVDGVKWALGSVLDATPADTAVLMMKTSCNDRWKPIAVAGIVPRDEQLRQALPDSVAMTPILDRFLNNKEMTKESYLPTLQALPGRVEFTYLPQNSQEALLVPVSLSLSYIAQENVPIIERAVLVLGSDTAKSFTPRDVAWCQVIAARIGTFVSS